MKKVNFTKLVLGCAIGLSFATMAQSSSAYVHKATAGTITSSKTILDTAVLNGNSNLVLLATHNYNPPGATGVYVNKSLGFRFQSLKWYIYNNDVSNFIPNSHYNVFIPGTDAYAWTHTTAVANIVGNYTIIDDGRINNNPNAKVFVADQLGNYNPNRIGVFYSTSASKWCVYNQGGLPQVMPANQVFNIIVPKGNTGYSHIIHTADGTNTSNHITYVDHPNANDNPDAILLITQVWNPGGTASGIYNDHHVGVYYSSTQNKWAIYNEDLAAMPAGASFNVMVFKNNTIGVDETELAHQNVKVAPNPVAAGVPVTLVLDADIQGHVEIRIYDLTARIVKHATLAKNQQKETFTLLTDGMHSGMYVLSVYAGGKVHTQKLIVN